MLDSRIACIASTESGSGGGWERKLWRSGGALKRGRGNKGEGLRFQNTNLVRTERVKKQHSLTQLTVIIIVVPCCRRLGESRDSRLAREGGESPSVGVVGVKLNISSKSRDPGDHDQSAGGVKRSVSQSNGRRGHSGPVVHTTHHFPNHFAFHFYKMFPAAQPSRSLLTAATVTRTPRRLRLSLLPAPPLQKLGSNKPNSKGAHGGCKRLAIVLLLGCC